MYCTPAIVRSVICSFALLFSHCFPLEGFVQIQIILLVGCWPENGKKVKND